MKDPRNPTEAEIEMAVCHLLRVRRFFFWKNPTRGYFSGKFQADSSGRRVMVGSFRKDTNPYTMRGVADILIVHKGQLIGFEIKSLKGVQSEEQKTFEKSLIASGGKYYLIKSIEDAEIAIREILK
jgi:hypothetical protein